MEQETVKYFSKADLGRRWNVKPQAVNNWEKRHSDFPPVIFRLGNGMIPVYEIEDVKKYEQARGLNKGG